MKPKIFHIVQHRFILAVLLIVFIAGTVVISNSSPTGFQSSGQQLPKQTMIYKVGSVSEKYPGTNYASVRTIDFGELVDVSSIDFEATPGGEHCTAGIALYGEVPRPASETSKIIPIPGVVRPSDYYQRDVLLTSYELMPHEKFSIYTEGEGRAQRFSVETTHVESDDSIKLGSKFTIKIVFKIFKVLVRSVGRIITDGVPVTDRVTDCKYIDDFKARIVLAPTSKMTSDKTPPFFDKLVMKEWNKNTGKYVPIQQIAGKYLVRATIEDDPEKKIVLNDYEISLSAHDDQSGVSDFIVTTAPKNIIQSVSLLGCSANMNCNFNIRELDSEVGKEKVLRVQSVNGAGLKSVVKEFKYVVLTPDGKKVDRPPQVEFSVSPTTLKAGEYVTVSISEADLAVDRIIIYKNGGPVVDCHPGNCKPYKTTLNQAGTLEFEVEALDSNGKKIWTSETITVTFSSQTGEQIQLPQGRSGTEPETEDTTPPTVSVSYSPSSPQVGSDVTFTVKASDNVGVAKVALLIDNLPVTLSCSAANSCTYKTKFSSARTYSYFASASDESGNVGRTVAKSFTVAAPAASASVPPEVSVSPASPIADNLFTITATPKHRSDTTVTRIEVFVDGKVAKTCYAEAPCEYASSFNAVGTHTYYAKVTYFDGAPIISQTKSFTVLEKDTQPPTIALSYSPQNPGFGDQIQVTATSTDNVGVKSIDVYVVGVDNAKKANGYIDTCTFSTPKTSASCTKTVYKKSGYNQLLFKATATDTSGNTYTPDSKTIVLRDNLKPTVIASYSPPTPKDGDKVTITVSASDDTALQGIDLFVNNGKVSAKCTVPQSSSSGRGAGARSAVDGSVGTGPSLTSGFQTFFNSFWSITGAQVLGPASSIGQQPTIGGTSGNQFVPGSSNSVVCTYAATYGGTASILYYAVAVDTSGNTAKTRPAIVGS